MQASNSHFSHRVRIPGLMILAGLILIAACLDGFFLFPIGAAAQTDDAVKFHHQESGPKVDYGALLASAMPLADSPDGQKLLSDCIEAYGGLDKLETLKSFQLTHVLGGNVGSDNVAFVKSFRRDRSYKIVEGDKERILNGKKCWVQDEEQTWEMEDFRLSR